jgi:hypothetical protein
MIFSKIGLASLMDPQFANNPFVLRQTQSSSFSHYNGNIEDIPKMAQVNFLNAKEGYRDGVITIRVPPEGFFSSVVSLTEGQELTGSYVPRAKDEAPRKQIRAKGATKIPAAQVDIVLYRSDVLAEDGDNHLKPSTNNWEVISINAAPVVGEMPIDPMTLMSNHFGADGGTDTKMTDAELVAALREGFDFWSNKALASGS